jgi:hypothetical protein
MFLTLVLFWFVLFANCLHLWLGDLNMLYLLGAGSIFYVLGIFEAVEPHVKANKWKQDAYNNRNICGCQMLIIDNWIKTLVGQGPESTFLIPYRSYCHSS